MRCYRSITLLILNRTSTLFLSYGQDVTLTVSREERLKVQLKSEQEHASAAAEQVDHTRRGRCVASIVLVCIGMDENEVCV